MHPPARPAQATGVVELPYLFVQALLMVVITCETA